MTPGAPVLVDSSVWVRSWRPGFPEPRARLHRLLEEDRVAGHPFVFGELLVGDQGTRRERLALYPDTTMPVTVVTANPCASPTSVYSPGATDSKS